MRKPDRIIQLKCDFDELRSTEKTRIKPYIVEATRVFEAAVQDGVSAPGVMTIMTEATATIIASLYAGNEGMIEKIMANMHNILKKSIDEKVDAILTMEANEQKGH